MLTGLSVFCEIREMVSLSVFESNAQHQACRENVLNTECSPRMFSLSLNVQLVTGASSSGEINREVAALRKLVTFYLLLKKMQGFDRLPVAKKRKVIYCIDSFTWFLFLRGH